MQVISSQCDGRRLIMHGVVRLHRLQLLSIALYNRPTTTVHFCYYLVTYLHTAVRFLHRNQSCTAAHRLLNPSRLVNRQYFIHQLNQHIVRWPDDRLSSIFSVFNRDKSNIVNSDTRDCYADLAICLLAVHGRVRHQYSLR